MTVEIFFTLFLVLLNGFFVAAEFAIVKVRASQLEVKAQQGNRFAILGKHVILHLDSYLAATQLGITLASLGLGWIGEPVVSKIIVSAMQSFGLEISPKIAHAIALPLSFSIITILHIVFGELAPKSIAIQRSEKTTLSVVYPLHFFFILFKPFIWTLNGIATILLGKLGISASHESEFHSSEELKYLVQEGAKGGVVNSEALDIINNAFKFSDQSARQIMIPRFNVLSININETEKSKIEKVIEEGYSRIPCFENNSDNIIGIIYLKDLLIALRKSENINLKDILRPSLFIPESKKIGELLREFQKNRQHMAIVVNEFGSFEGIITMEDILEELVGEIHDESDSDSDSCILNKITDNIFSALGSASIEKINQFLPAPIPKDKNYETLAGYLQNLSGKIPGIGEKVISEKYEFIILKKVRNAISLVKICFLRN
ncbi:MAG: HlyC/CorC family transporter [Candidatus Riflebacteria bacterium]|nr:HlyC/CorC family transporter [Candidatus Riflebacteria bacterium]